MNYKTIFKISTLLLLFSLFTNCATTLNKSPKSKNKTASFEAKKLILEVDSLIRISESMEYSTKPVVKRITEGSLKIFDSLKIEIGTGSFLRNMYTNQEKDEVVKADYSQTINYIYDASKNIDHTKEQIKTIIYYKNEKPYYATYNERKFNKESLTADDTYYFEFNTENIKENDSEKKIRKYVLYLSEDIISDK